MRGRRTLHSLWLSLVAIPALASCASSGIVAGSYFTGSEFDDVSLVVDGHGAGELRDIYLEPGTTTIHHLRYTLRREASDASGDVMSVSFGKQSCGSIGLRMARREPAIVIVTRGSVEQAFSAGQLGQFEQEEKELQKLADLQKRYPAKPIPIGVFYSFDCA